MVDRSGEVKVHSLDCDLLQGPGLSGSCTQAYPAYIERCRRQWRWAERGYTAPPDTPLVHISDDPRRAKVRINELRAKNRVLQAKVRKLTKNCDAEIETTHTEDIVQVAELLELADEEAEKELKDDPEASAVWKDHLRNAQAAAAHDGKRYASK